MTMVRFFKVKHLCIEIRPKMFYSSHAGHSIKVAAILNATLNISKHCLQTNLQLQCMIIWQASKIVKKGLSNLDGPGYDKIYKITFAPSEDSDLPAQTHRLIRTVTICVMKLTNKAPSDDWSYCLDALADLNLREANMWCCRFCGAPVQINELCDVCFCAVGAWGGTEELIVTLVWMIALSIIDFCGRRSMNRSHGTNFRWDCNGD